MPRAAVAKTTVLAHGRRVPAALVQLNVLERVAGSAAAAVAHRHIGIHLNHRYLRDQLLRVAAVLVSRVVNLQGDDAGGKSGWWMEGAGVAASCMTVAQSLPSLTRTPSYRRCLLHACASG
jgi:hypothetical protein